MSSHEPIQSHRSVILSSNRTFGLTFCGVLLLMAIWPWLRHGQTVRMWAFYASLTFGSMAIFKPQLLSPFNRLWFNLGLRLHTIVSPIIMAVLFYGAVTPMASILRLTGKDLLRQKNNDDPTYWINRDPVGPQEGSMKNQY